MAFTYTPGSPIGNVRFEVGDTEAADALLQDAEIQAFLDQEGGDELRASARAARGLAARFGRKVDFASDDQSFKLSQRATAFRALAQDLEERAKTSGAGIGSIAGKRKDGYDSEGNSFTGGDGLTPGGRARDRVKYTPGHG